MECISIFDMLKIGVGPSSSHTLGPWRAAERWISALTSGDHFDHVIRVKAHLYGSLSLTGKGHATDRAIILGLSGANPVTVTAGDIQGIVEKVKQTRTLLLGKRREVVFDPTVDILFHQKFLPFHANGLKFEAILTSGSRKTKTYYSIGGGFVVTKERNNAKKNMEEFRTFPFPITQGHELLTYCKKTRKSISEIVLTNERSLRSDAEIDQGIRDIWETMLESIYLGCHSVGKLPGGLNVRRRASEMHRKLIGDQQYRSSQAWLEVLRDGRVGFRQILNWVSCFALAVNEVNASLGRVVTAPTNGSAGVIPAVIMYYLIIEKEASGFDQIKRFLLVASEIGSIFKKGATISAAMGGCQAEIGVSAAMAAGGLTELLGGTPAQVLMAAEIAMEHHLGLTCDPVAGLVQIPCIERNSMGAIKAINAAELAVGSDPDEAKISLDKVVQTMWETAKDMNVKYKETSKGGLAVGVFLSDC